MLFIQTFVSFLYSINSSLKDPLSSKGVIEPVEDRIKLQNTLKASSKIWHNSSILATPRVVSKPVLGCSGNFLFVCLFVYNSGTFLETQTFCPNLALLNQILHFNKLSKSLAHKFIWEALLQERRPTSAVEKGLDWGSCGSQRYHSQTRCPQTSPFKALSFRLFVYKLAGSEPFNSKTLFSHSRGVNWRVTEMWKVR